MKRLTQVVIIVAMLFSFTACDNVGDFLRGLDMGILSEEGLIPDGTAFFVKAGGDDNNNDGLSAEKPFKTFDKAVQAAADHATIKRVAVVGTLTENESLSTDNRSTFVVPVTSSPEITIIGHGKNAVLAAATGKRVLLVKNHVFSDAMPIVLSNITLSGGGTTFEGGGLFVDSRRTVTLETGVIITHCVATNGGGGVCLVSSATFTMNGGSIQGNSCNSSGGGVFNQGTFTMNGGSIQGNSATSGGGAGGGVFTAGGRFIKIGGIIYGKDGGDNANRASTDSTGHAVYVFPGSKSRNTTAGVDVLLDSNDLTSGWGI